GAFERIGERLLWAGLDGRYDLPLAELAGIAGAGAGTRSGGRSGGASGGPDAADVARAIVWHLARAGVVAPQPSPPDRARGLIVGEWDRTVLGRCEASA